MIRRLSEDVRGRLRTGVALTSVAQCVEELVLNSVDAGSTCVAVRVDLQNLMIQVVDNGAGITREQLQLVGERYSTSKCHTVEDLDHLKYFGYRGEALASLCSASSFVEIITRLAGSISTLSKCFSKGKPLSVTEPKTPRPGTGTTVSAHNLFYNFPVRKKSLKEGLELEKIRFRVAGLALMQPLISFSLRDDVTGNVILQTHKCSGILMTFSSLFGGARAKLLREVEIQSDIFKMSGYVSRENYSRKDLQFVFVNKRLVLKSKVHKALNAVLSKSVLVRRRGNAGDKNDKQTGQDRSPVETGSPTKLFERYAVYVINIHCPLAAYDITFDPAKTLVEFHDWPELTSLIESMLLKFLKEENLLLPSDEPQDVEEPGISTATVDKDSAELVPDSFNETDDPFAGADEDFDEEHHASLERKRLTEGISTHNSLNSLFSQAVRRPALPREEEGFGDLKPSCAKKSRLENTVCGRSGQAEQNQSESWKLSSCTCDVENTVTSTTHRREKCAERVGLVQGQSYSLKNDHSLKEAYKNRDSTESMDDDDTELPLPKVIRPSKRVSSAAHKQTLSEKLRTQILSSSLTSSAQEICLPNRFAKSSSLSRLRASMVGTLTSSLSSSSSPSSSSSRGQRSVLQKFRRTEKQNITGHTAQEEASNLSNLEGDGNHTEIALPPSKRPLLFKSKSLDAGYRCGDRDFDEHRNPDTRDDGNAKLQSLDDSCISYASSPISFTETGSEKNSVMNVRQHPFTSTTGVHLGSCAALRSGHTVFRDHQSHSSHLHHMTCSKESVSTGGSTKASGRNPVLADRSEHPISLASRKQPTHVQKAGSAVDADNETQRLRHSECSDCQTSSISSGLKQSTSRPGNYTTSTSWSLGISQPDPRTVRPSQSTSRPAGLTHSSKLARLMRREVVSSSDVDIAGSAEAGGSRNLTCLHVQCCCSKRNPLVHQHHKSSYSGCSAVHRPQGNKAQKSHGGDQSTSNRFDVTAGQLLHNTDSASSILQLGHRTMTESEKPRSVRDQHVQFPEPSRTASVAYPDFIQERMTDTPESEFIGQHGRTERVHWPNTASVSCNQLPQDDVNNRARGLTKLSQNEASSKETDQEGRHRGQRSGGSVVVSLPQEPFLVRHRMSQQNTRGSACGAPVTSPGDALVTPVTSPDDALVMKARSSRGNHMNCSGNEDELTARSVKGNQTTSSRNASDICLLPHAKKHGSGVVSVKTCSSLANVSVSLIQDSERAQRGDLFQQSTQGFAAQSSQGFDPQPAEEGSMPFDTNPTVMPWTASQAHTDSPASAHTESPMSACSVGFSPGVDDPMLAGSDAEIIIRPAVVQGHPNQTGSSSSCPISDAQVSQQALDNDAKSVRSSGEQSAEKRETDGQKFSPQKFESSSPSFSHTSAQDSDLEKGQTAPIVQPTNMASVESIESPVNLHGDVIDQLLNPSGGLSTNQNVAAPQMFTTDSQSQISPKDLALSANETDLEEEMVFTNSSEIQCGQRMIHLSAGSSSVTDSSVTSSHAADSRCTESLLSRQSTSCGRSAGEAAHRAERNITGDRSQREEEQQLKQLPEDKNAGFQSKTKPDDISDNERSIVNPSCEQSCSRIAQTLSVSCESGGESRETRSQAKRKMVVERTYNLSFLSGKKPRSLITPSSSFETAERDGVPKSSAVDSLACSEEMTLENLTQEPVLPTDDLKLVLDKGEVTTLEQTDSFSDSVPDHAFTCIEVLGSQGPGITATGGEMNSQNSLPDSALVNIAMPEKQDPGTPVEGVWMSVSTPGPVPDTASQNIETSEKETEDGATVGDAEVIVSTPSSVPDSLIVRVLTPPQEPSIPIVSKMQTRGEVQSPASSDSLTPVNSARIQTAVNDSITQNAYKLGSAPSGTSGTSGSSRAKEDGGVTSSVFQSVFPQMVSSWSSGTEGRLASEGLCCNSQGPAVEGCSGEELTVKGCSCEGLIVEGCSGEGLTIEECSSTKQDMDAEKEEEEEEEEEKRKADSRESARGVVWIPVTDPTTGDRVYMNSSSGHTLTQAQWKEKDKQEGQLDSKRAGQAQTTCLRTPSPQQNTTGELSPLSHQRLEALISEHLEGDEAEAGSKWREGSRDVECEHTGGQTLTDYVECEHTGGQTLTDLLAGWQNPVFKIPLQIVQTSTRNQVSKAAQCFFPPTTFTKAMLSRAKVIGQLDNKFVACRIQDSAGSGSGSSSSNCPQGEEGDGLVVLLDQHAAHERIRLEQLKSDVYEKEGTTGGLQGWRIQRCDVKPPRTVVLSEEDVRLMQSFWDEFQRIGVEFDVDGDQRDKVHVHTIPACMAQREANDRKRGKDPLSYEYVQIMIREHNQLLLSTAGAKQQLPQQVHRLLATHACKGAIKFGDKLSESTCQELLSSLSSCELPFQCAHGRPSITPLISLKQLRLTSADTRRPPNLWKLRQKMAAPADEGQ